MRPALWRHGAPAAAGILLGVVTGLLINAVSSDATPAAIGALLVVALAWAGIEAWARIRDAPAPTGGTSGNASPHSSENVSAPPWESPVREAAMRVRVSAKQVDGGTVRGIVAPQPPTSADVQVTVGDAKNATIAGIDLSYPRTGTDAR
jgi:hypothetical protein